MSIKKALFYAFTIGVACVFITWFFGHLWMFIILIITTLVVIVSSVSDDDDDKKPN